MSPLPKSRIPLVRPEELSTDQLEQYNFSERGKLDIFRLLANSAVLQPLIHDISQALFTSLSLPPIERELIVLATLSLERGKYPWAQHVSIAEALDIPQVQVEAIERHEFLSASFSEKETALLVFTKEVVTSVRVKDSTYHAISQFYSAQQIVETIWTIGHYMTLTRLTEVAELPVDNVLGAKILKQATDGDY